MKEEITRSLSEPERKEFFQLEEIIHNGYVYMRDCDKALRKIRDKKLYREQFSTFQDYCASKWGSHRSTVNRLLQVSDARKEFGAICAKPSEKPLKTLVKNASDH